MTNLKILIVEGGDDKDFVREILEKRKIPFFNHLEIKTSGGINNLYDYLRAAVLEETYSVIGILVDADLDIKKRWNDLKKILIESGYKDRDIPKNLATQGIIIESKGDLAKIGIWIMPNNHENGTLEDLIKLLIPSDDDLLPIIEATISKLMEEGKNRFSKNKKSKAILHTWLAWQKRPELSIGMAIKQNYLSNDKNADEFILWLQKLFKD